MSFKSISYFEKEIANFFNAPFCIATDCCTHSIELCLRYTKANAADSPYHTYISVPFTFEKLQIPWRWRNYKWRDYYYITDRVIDAAVYWQKDGYVKNTYMCISFQYKKHLGLGRGGAILLDSDYDYNQLKKMSYDGRQPDIPWAEQNIDRIGYHYYMTPEIAELGLKKLPEAIEIESRKWSWKDYPDLSTMAIFNA